MEQFNDHLVKGVYDQYGLDRSFGGPECRDEIDFFFKVCVLMFFLPFNYWLFNCLAERKNQEDAAGPDLRVRVRKKPINVDVFDYSHPVSGRFSEPLESSMFLYVLY